jgi:uncharacterized membrane protein YhaH (DUF805 family)
VNWASLFLRSQGRIGRGRFWLGFTVLVGLQALACLVPHAGWFAFTLLTYGWICLYAKRLHDIGRSGWLTMTPILATLLALSAAAAFWLRTFSGKAETPSLLWMSVGVLAAASAIDLAFVAWVGLSPGETDENSYGLGLSGSGLVEGADYSPQSSSKSSSGSSAQSSLLSRRRS